MKPAKVSVILPCYNVANCMSDMFVSLRNQTFSDIEIICVDDKSTDDTIEQIKSFMQLDKRICLYKLPKNGGVGHARNYGLKKATGKFVCFLDPDDYIDNDFVEKLYNGITKNKSDVAKGNMISGENISSVNTDIRKNHLYFNSQHCSAIYNRDFLLKNNILYPEDVLTGQDAVFLSNLVLHTNKIFTIDDAFYHYVRRDGSLDSVKQLSHDKILSRIKMLDYKVQMLNSYVFDTDENKNIFIRYHILNHFMYTFDTKRVSETGQKMLFDWLIKHADTIGYDNLASRCKPHQIQAIKNYDFDKFVTPGYKGKLFYKERYPDGHRTIYFCGIKIFSYTKQRKRIRTINYKTYDDLAKDIKTNIHKIPNNIDLIVGVPRSGMIPAYILALSLNKRVCSLQEFISGQYGGHGITRKIDESSDIKNVLIIDDSIDSGNSLDNVKQLLSSKLKQYKCYFAAVYCSNKTTATKVDIPFVILPQPRVFQWNYLNHRIAEYSAYDIDGVLCVDPTEEENDDGDKYRHFILNARPLYIPKRKIAAIVTSRLEKWRPETEAWLTKHHIEYDKLYMLKNMTFEERRKKGVHAQHKAKIYKQLKNTDFFIESDPKQAEQIAKLSGKKVFCAMTDELFE